MLFDYYGELLNEKQKGIYEDTVLNDMSLSEIGDAEGISKQAVSEIMQRCDEKLEQYEESLGLIRRTERIQGYLEDLDEIAGKLDTEHRIVLHQLKEKIKKEL